MLLWRRGANVLTASQLMVTRDERIRLVNGYNLEISELEPQDAGDYVCQISDKINKDQVHTVEILGKCEPADELPCKYMWFHRVSPRNSGCREFSSDLAVKRGRLPKLKVICVSPTLILLCTRCSSHFSSRNSAGENVRKTSNRWGNVVRLFGNYYSSVLMMGCHTHAPGVRVCVSCEKFRHIKGMNLPRELVKSSSWP